MSTSMTFSHLFSTSFEASCTQFDITMETYEEFAAEITERNTDLSFVHDGFLVDSSIIADSSSDVPLWTKSFFDSFADEKDDKFPASISIYSSESVVYDQEDPSFFSSFSVSSNDTADFFDARSVEFSPRYPSSTYFLYPLNINPKDIEEAEPTPVKKQSKVLQKITNLADKLVGRTREPRRVVDEKDIVVIPNEYLWR